MVAEPSADEYTRRLTVASIIKLASQSENSWQLVGVAEGQLNTEMVFDLSYGFQSWDREQQRMHVVRRVRIRITTEEE